MRITAEREKFIRKMVVEDVKKVAHTMALEGQMLGNTDRIVEAEVQRRLSKLKGKP